jgi:hypothetical protein
MTAFANMVFAEIGETHPQDRRLKMTLAMNAAAPSHPRLRTAGALIAGFVAVAALSVAADAVLHAMNYYPNDGTVGSDGGLGVALAYRTVFTVLGGYITARLAPAHPQRLAIILGAIGTLFAILGAATMWNVGHQWYPVALAILALPSTALGGWLFTRLAR